MPTISRDAICAPVSSMTAGATPTAMIAAPTGSTLRGPIRSASRPPVGLATRPVSAGAPTARPMANGAAPRAAQVAGQDAQDGAECGVTEEGGGEDALVGHPLQPGVENASAGPNRSGATVETWPLHRAPHGDADLAALGAVLAEPARARMLLALGDGRALPASVLATEAGVAPSTAAGTCAGSSTPGC